MVAHEGAQIKYSTVQNWYPGDAQGNGGIYNFVTKRGLCAGRKSKISWTQVETGSAVTWKYPSVILAGDESVGDFHSVAVTRNFQQADTGTKMVHVPYQSSPAAMTALMRGDVHMAALPAISVTPQAEAGKAKILAVSLPKRSPFLPNIPTLKESGIDVEADTWMGLIAPDGTSPAVIEAIHRDVADAITSKSAREKLATQLMEPVGNSPAAFRKVIEDEITRWSPIIKAADVKIN